MTCGRIANGITIALLVHGLFMRMMIMSEKKSFFHSFKQIDLTLARRVHAVGGIIVWCMTRIIMLCGSAIFSYYSSSAIFYAIFTEIILFALLMIALETIRSLKFVDSK
jgi:FtsH-binding integral membrane protein